MINLVLFRKRNCINIWISVLVFFMVVNHVSWNRLQIRKNAAHLYPWNSILLPKPLILSLHKKTVLITPIFFYCCRCYWQIKQSHKGIRDSCLLLFVVVVFFHAFVKKHSTFFLFLVFGLLCLWKKYAKSTDVFFNIFLLKKYRKTSRNSCIINQQRLSYHLQHIFCKLCVKNYVKRGGADTNNDLATHI